MTSVKHFKPEDDDRYSMESIKKVERTLSILKIFGMYYNNKDSGCLFAKCLRILYFLLLLAIYLLHCVRYGIAISKSASAEELFALVYRLIIHSFATILYTILVYRNSKYGRNILAKEQQLQLVTTRHNVFMKHYYWIVASVVSAINLSFLVSIYNTYSTDTHNIATKVRVAPLDPLSVDTTLYLTIYCLFWFLLINQFAIDGLYFALHCVIIGCHFDSLSIDSIESQPKHRIFEIRKQHNIGCAAIGALNSVYAHFIAAVVIFLLPSICVALYVALITQYTATLVGSFTGVLYITIKMISMFYVCNGVHEKAHAPLEKLQDIEIWTWDEVGSRTIQHWIYKLQNTTIGIEATGLFTITKTTIITILGSLITYAVIVFQMSLDTPTNCHCGNSTRT